MTIKRPYSPEEFKEFIGKAIDSGLDHQVLDEDGKTVLSGGGCVEFMRGDLCPVCYNLKETI